jgi:hypothetical protein
MNMFETSLKDARPFVKKDLNLFKPTAAVAMPLS